MKGVIAVSRTQWDIQVEIIRESIPKQREENKRLEREIHAKLCKLVAKQIKWGMLEEESQELIKTLETCREMIEGDGDMN